MWCLVRLPFLFVIGYGLCVMRYGLRVIGYLLCIMHNAIRATKMALVPYR